MLITATKQTVAEFDALTEKRKSEIRNTPDTLTIMGTCYYVSNEGDDTNDGRSPDTPWKTLAKVGEFEFCEGDTVLFRRGDLFRGGIRIAAPHFTVGAYGEGDKPKFFGAARDLKEPSLWQEVDSAHHIWKWGEKILDVGTIVFNEGEQLSIKLIPSYIGGRFVCRDDESKPFVMAEEMIRDLDLYWHFEDKMTTHPSKGEDFPIPDPIGGLGDLYLRCDRGNPALVFDTVEAISQQVVFRLRSKASYAHFDNLCIQYAGFAIGGSGPCITGLHVTNCEMGWIGGQIQHYFGTDPNYPEGKRGTVTRFGNAVEIYGGCNDYVVENCYIYQCFDAGITHQVNTGGTPYAMENIRYANNLIEDCVYGIEYFLDQQNGDTESYMKNVEMCGNIIRHSGYGWGQQRHNTHTPAHIKGWSYVNTASDFSIHHNIFGEANYRMLHLVAQKEESCPVMYENTYLQNEDKPLGQYGGNELAEPPILPFDRRADKTIETIFKDQNAKVYLIEK